MHIDSDSTALHARSLHPLQPALGAAAVPAADDDDDGWPVLWLAFVIFNSKIIVFSKKIMVVISGSIMVFHWENYCFEETNGFNHVCLLASGAF